MNLLNCNEKTVIKAKKELQDFGLLKEVQQGVNKPNRLYISGTVKNPGQELEKIQSIKTDNIKTNISRLNEPEGAGDNTLYSIEDAPPQNDLGIVHDWIFSEFGRYPTPFEIEDLKTFLQDHNKEVIKLAIKECVGNGKPYFKYLSSILRDWKQKGLVTAELVENRQKPARRTNTGSNRVVFQEYDDPLPF